MSAQAAIAAAHAHSRQAFLMKPRELVMRDVIPPHPGPGEVLIQVKCALSCGTDLKAFRRGHPMWPMPTPFGHEFSGTVVEIGEGVKNFAIDDAIMAAPTAPCGICFYCRRGQENLCAQAMEKMLLGAYADYLLVPAHIVRQNAFHKPDDLPFEEAALLEPLSCVVHAQEVAQPQPFESALIVGAGPFGLLHLLALRERGVREVAIAGRGADRLKWAAALGPDRVIDVRNGDPGREVQSLNGGYGPDLVIECTGQVDGWHQSLGYVRCGGRVVFFGGCAPGTTLNIDTRRMHYDNLTLLAPFHFRPRDVKRAFEILATRKLGASAIINARRTLGELAEVFSLLEAGSILKCAIVP
ncbi:MAG TPA: alcohol dehydrogenase catalytic domain-containing protein [Candidatus Binataceae bacterium]|nr:alcohol dehydrogenase catalytic domain-containing protein [Candidatus Binataceae bacterium]